MEIEGSLALSVFLKLVQTAKTLVQRNSTYLGFGRNVETATEQRSAYSRSSRSSSEEKLQLHPIATLSLVTFRIPGGMFLKTFCEPNNISSYRLSLSE